MYANKSLRPVAFYFILLSALFFSAAAPLAAESSTELAGFSTVWKLMSPADREVFISGYIRGWKDSSEFLDIAIEYVKANPQQATDTLVKLRDLANLGDQKPAPLAIFIDKFYQNPKNQGAPLSKAVSAANAAGLQAEVQPE